MTALKVGKLEFIFPDGWLVSKYDDWQFYRNNFVTQFDGIKAVDLLACDQEGVIVYFIEVKDYRHPNAKKPSDLPKVIAEKVLMTLAAKLNGVVQSERNISEAVLTCKQLKVVAHIEQCPAHQPIVNLADIKDKLTQLLRAVDAEPKVVSKDKMSDLCWSVK